MSYFPALIGTLVLATLGGGPRPPAVTTTRYHLSAKVDQSIDLSVFGQPAQLTNQTLDAWVLMTTTDSGGGRVVHVVVDSAAMVSNAPGFDPGTAAAAKGATIHGFQDPQGRVKNLTSSQATNPVVTGIQSAVNGLFPRVRAGAKPGESWVDTTDVPNPGEGNNTTLKLVTTYTAGAGEAVGGLSGMRVNAKSTSAVTGTMTSPQAGTMEVDGAGAGAGSFVVAGDGRFLGGSVNSSQDLRLKVAMAPAPIPVRVTQTLVVTMLK